MSGVEEEEQLERRMPPAFTLLEGTGTLGCLFELFAFI